MSRLSISANGLRITHRNGVQFHTWPSKEYIDEARKIALAWKDDELLADIDKPGRVPVVAGDAANDVIDLDTAEPDAITGSVNSDMPELHAVPEKPRRGRKPKVQQ